MEQGRMWSLVYALRCPISCLLLFLQSGTLMFGFNSCFFIDDSKGGFVVTNPLAVYRNVS